MVPPMLAMTAVESIMLSVYLRMLGILASSKQLLRRTLLESSASLPILLVYFAIGLVFYDLRLGIMLLVAAVVVSVVVASLKKRHLNIAPYALESGPLRDRAFKLAERCGVKLQQVYVLPPDLMKTINAMASSGDQIYLTDALIQNLSKQEVDAVIAHELGHLKHRHAGSIGIIFVVGIVLMNIFSSAAGMLLQLDYAFPIGVVLFIVVTRYLSRRFEYTADTHSAYLMGDPRPLISALVKMSRLSLMPMAGSSGFEMILTHPHTANRVDALGRLGNVAKEEWPQLLKSEPAEDRYDLTSIRAEEDRLFSSGHKQKLFSRGGWALIFERILLPAAAALVVQAFGLHGLTALAAYLIGTGVTLIVYFWLSNVIPVWGCGVLKKGFEQKLKVEGLDCESIGYGCFVGFSPGPELRIYENNTDWDIGYLFLSGSKLVYVGEQTRFALSRSQVQEISHISETTHWVKSQRICINWRDPANDEAGAFSFHSNDVASLTDATRKTLSLSDRIREWKTSPEPSVETLPATLAGLGPPRIGEVTSHSLGDSVTRGKLLVTWLMILVITVAVTAILRLSFIPRNGGGALYVIGMSLGVTLVGMVPLMRYPKTKKPEETTRQLLARLEVAGATNAEINASREV
jgi:Zn-dependent protease with chaperone function